MAFHNSTPAAVLNAPAATPRWVIHHTGPNRAQRRHYTTKTGATRTIPKAFRPGATNLPLFRRLRPPVQIGTAIHAALEAAA